MVGMVRRGVPIGMTSHACLAAGSESLRFYLGAITSSHPITMSLTIHVPSCKSFT